MDDIENVLKLMSDGELSSMIEHLTAERERRGVEALQDLRDKGTLYRVKATHQVPLDVCFVSDAHDDGILHSHALQAVSHEIDNHDCNILNLDVDSIDQITSEEDVPQDWMTSIPWDLTGEESEFTVGERIQHMKDKK